MGVDRLVMAAIVVEVLFGSMNHPVIVPFR